MAEEDEIDIIGDFSFNSCFAQNNQGIPSCSDREDTVHPQWLLDSTATNWYDIQSKDSNRLKEGPSRKLSGTNSSNNYNNEVHTTWTQSEKEILVKEMAKYGRNVRKISQTLKTKTEIEIQALIEAEYGVNLDTPQFGLDKNEDQDDVPAVVQEEIVTDDISNINEVINMVTTGSTTISLPKKPFRKKVNYQSKNSLLKPHVFDKNQDLIAINPSEILYEDDLIIGSTESIGSEVDLTDVVSRSIVKNQKAKVVKKIGNHRRKVSRNYDKNMPRNRSKDVLKSPQGRQRKDSSLSDESLKSPKMQIVLGSGQALPVSEGEQVIKIEKKKDSDPESDIEVDVDSGNEEQSNNNKKEKEKPSKPVVEEAPIAVPLTKFEPMPRRQKKINLDGGGGYTIMHTEAGDLYAIGAEPRKERQPRKQPIHLIPCRFYNAERPAPYEVRLHVSTLISMDVHAHTSRAEVMGLVGGVWDEDEWDSGGIGDSGVMGDSGGIGDSGAVRRLTCTAYRAAAAAAGSTHCEMEPVSQAMAAESLQSAGGRVCGWHHSHPVFPAAPSARDLRTQAAFQRALQPSPCLGFITSQHWSQGRDASHYRCVRVEEDEQSPDTPVGYQLKVKLVADLTCDNLPRYLLELRGILRGDGARTEYSLDMTKDVCPQAGRTYLEKCISSVSQHMRSAGYSDSDAVTTLLIQAIRDVFR